MKKAGAHIYTFLIFLFLYAPILVLIVFSFNDTETGSRAVFLCAGTRSFLRID